MEDDIQNYLSTVCFVGHPVYFSIPSAGLNIPRYWKDVKLTQIFASDTAWYIYRVQSTSYY